MFTNHGSQIQMNRYRNESQDVTTGRQKESVTTTGITNHAGDHIARNAIQGKFTFKNLKLPSFHTHEYNISEFVLFACMFCWLWNR